VPLYPFKSSHHTYPRNAWYVAAWSSEITRTLFERTILGERVVFYRTEAGVAVALDGRCAHRRFPLAAGKLAGDDVVCQYHGWQYDASGACTRIPSQDRVPPGCKIRSYPTVEIWNWVWIWTGDPVLADPALIPDHASELKLQHPDWYAVTGGHQPLNARYQLLNENVLDLSHLSFVHDGSIGTAAVAATKVEVDQLPFGVRATRQMRGGEVPETFRQLLKIEGPADRTTSSTFYPPALLASGSRFSAPAHNGAAPHVYGEFRVMHVGTPETPTTTHYFWAWTRTFARGDDAFSDRMTAMLLGVFFEDKQAIEIQERAIGEAEDGRTDFSAGSDAAALRGRHLLEAMMDAEAAVPA
jgi:vanillate O-demethylase monooxygenase subunit